MPDSGGVGRGTYPLLFRGREGVGDGIGRNFFVRAEKNFRKIIWKNFPEKFLRCEKNFEKIFRRVIRSLKNF
jgi:hypothetical protein